MSRRFIQMILIENYEMTSVWKWNLRFRTRVFCTEFLWHYNTKYALENILSLPFCWIFAMSTIDRIFLFSFTFCFFFFLLLPYITSIQIYCVYYIEDRKIHGFMESAIWSEKQKAKKQAERGIFRVHNTWECQNVTKTI